MTKTKVICFANNKGGSGKSTTCASLGYAFAARGKKVLLVDGDMQLNLTLSYFDEDKALEIAKGEKNLYAAVKEQKPLTEYSKWQREFILRKMLKPVLDEGVYDYVLIDAPPTLGCWVMNILCASDKLILPVEASPWGLFGLANMFDFVAQVKEISPALSLAGVVVTKVDTRKNYVKQTLETLKSTEGISVFDNIIHIDSSVEWAQDNSKPVGAFRKSTRSATEYGLLADELLEKL